MDITLPNTQLLVTILKVLRIAFAYSDVPLFIMELKVLINPWEIENIT
jgi:hypothetical protein